MHHDISRLLPRLTAGSLLALCLLWAGCEGPMFEGSIFERRPPAPPPQAVFPIEPTGVNALSAQVEALNQSLAFVEQRITRLEQNLNARQQGVLPAQAEIQALRNEVQMLRNSQAKIRQEITADLAARIDRIAARQEAAYARPQGRNERPAVQPPAPSRSGYEHKVARGQTLSQIAQGYGTTVQAIMKANNIKNPSAIQAGQTLFIPDPER